jgi:rhamnose utilization protein RhaD (predicted bifunctional aldolase and dehydrogenase)
VCFDGSKDEYWPNVTPLMIAPRGQRVAIETVKHTMMPHPMHLHGHAFQRKMQLLKCEVHRRAAEIDQPARVAHFSVKF